MDFPLTRAVLQSGLTARAYPAAVVEVGRTSGVLLRHAIGQLTFDADAPACTTDTVFDLASLTKVIASASFAMRQTEAGRLALEAPVGAYLPEWGDPVHQRVTIRHLLEHSSGLPAHRRLWEQARGRAAMARAIHDVGLERAPGEAAVYSDLGFILLGFILEDLAGASLAEQMLGLAATVGEPALAYRPSPQSQAEIAPTEFDPWRNRLLRGDVHDENAAALDGVAAHAGLFGTASGVGAFARLVLDTFIRRTWLGSPGTIRRFVVRSAVPGSSRALAWDTMLPTSSCGTRLSATAFGHTGFTGTSLWIDHARDVYVVLLTNRVHPTRSNDAIRGVRPRLHDAVMEDLIRAAVLTGEA